MHVNIRSATVDDAAEIAEVRIITWRKAYQGLLPDSLLSSLDIEAETNRYRDGIAHLPPERSVLVAEIEPPRNSIAGFAICGPDREPGNESTGEIYALYVLPEYQGQGAGRSLVQSAARWLANKGFQRMIIFVLRENAPARKFYEATGGVIEREKTVEIRGVQAAEVGYGYDLCRTGLVEKEAGQRGNQEE